MPLFVYICTCGAVTDSLRPAATRNDYRCPACGKPLTPSPSAPALKADRDTEGKAR